VSRGNAAGETWSFIWLGSAVEVTLLASHGVPRLVVAAPRVLNDVLGASSGRE
jgi:hypothetical protein